MAKSNETYLAEVNALFGGKGELSELSGGVQREDPPRMVSSWKKRAIDRIMRDEEKITAVLMHDMDRKPKSVKLVRNRKEEDDTDIYFDLKVNGKVIGGISSGYPHEDWSFGPEDSMKSYGKLDKPYEAILKAAIKTLGYKTRSRGYDESVETLEEGRRSLYMILERSGFQKAEMGKMLDHAKVVRDNIGNFLHYAKKGQKKVNEEEWTRDFFGNLFDQWERQFGNWKSHVNLIKTAYDSYDRVVPVKEDKDTLMEAGSTAASIKALRDTDYRDSSAYFKMVQLLKGVAAVAENDKMADKFLSAVSDALTSAARKVLPGTDDGEDDPKEESRGKLGDDLLAFAQGKKN